MHACSFFLQSWTFFSNSSVYSLLWLSKRYHFQVVDLQQPSSSVEEPVKSTDWSKCFLCQQFTSEILRCRPKSKRSAVGVGQGYSTLAKNFMHFNELNDLPMPIDPQQLDERNGIEATLLEHEAKWHKSCHTKFNSTQLIRGEKRKLSVEDCKPAVNPARSTFADMSVLHLTYVFFL